MKKETIRNIVRTLILAPIACFIVYSMCFFIVHPVHPKYEDCGKVISKSQDETVIKYGTETELYLNVQFKKTGFKSVKVGATTYFGTKVGETVCFDLNKDVGVYYMFTMMAGVFFWAVSGIVALVFLIRYLIGPEICNKNSI